MIKKLRELEKGKLYWVQIDVQEGYEDVIKKIKDMGRSLEVSLIITGKKINFIDAPKGYEVHKIKRKKIRRR